jgi:hypothetical protein
MASVRHHRMDTRSVLLLVSCVAAIVLAVWLGARRTKHARRKKPSFCERVRKFGRAPSLLFAAICCATIGKPAIAQQMADPNFDASVDSPAFALEHPSVSIDEAHHNFHTASGRYAPLAELLKNELQHYWTPTNL